MRWNSLVLGRTNELAPPVQTKTLAASSRRRAMSNSTESGRHHAVSGASSRVLVMRGSRASIVDLRRLYATNLHGVRVVSLADVWVAAQLPGDLFALSFDFIDDDGVRASHASGPKLDNGQFVRGWIDLDTRDLVWDPSAEVAGHWRARAVSTIVAIDDEPIPAPP
jgi:hypothetical protein